MSIFHQDFTHDLYQQFGLLRLRDIPISSKADSELFILAIRVMGGIEDEWDMSQLLIRFTAPAQLKTIQARHEDVRDYKIGWVFSCRIKSIESVADESYFIIAPFQQRLKQITVFRIVVCDKDLGHSIVPWETHFVKYRPISIRKVSGLIGFSM